MKDEDLAVELKSVQHGREITTMLGDLVGRFVDLRHVPPERIVDHSYGIERRWQGELTPSIEYWALQEYADLLGGQITIATYVGLF
jgi:hypothetical protein